MSLRVLLFVAFIFGSFATSAQNESQLALRYYRSGEFEKAADLYEKLYRSNVNNESYLASYLKCLMSIEDYDRAEKTIKDIIKNKPTEAQFYVNLGGIYEQKLQNDKAEDAYQNAIKNLPANHLIINRVGNAFVRLTRYDDALKVYEKGSALLNDETIFSNNLADIYRRKGDKPRMIHYYLNSAKKYKNRSSIIERMFMQYLAKEDYETLQTQLYERIQEEPDEVVYVDLLAWVFIQSKEYGKAFRQARALDRKLEENGKRVFDIARTAANDKDYQTALKAYDYIIESKGVNSSYYIDAKEQWLLCKRQSITENLDYTKLELSELQSEYQLFIDEFGVNRQTAQVMLDYAELEALYLNDLQKAIELLYQVKDIRGVNKNVIADAKLTLADYFLIQGEIWESTLLYSQVDKDFKEDFIGELARFKNAKLSYYNGDFEWAQAQFDILKASTSKLISNDAIDMSVFIMDNMGLDTTDVPLKMYAEADMLIFQNKFDQAFQKLDSIAETYPDHSLQDDLLYSKANIYRMKKEYEPAIDLYNTIIEKHVEEIRCDNAIFELAELYEKHLKDTTKAMEYYEKLFIDFSNSTLAVEARKRFRILRGDEIQ